MFTCYTKQDRFETYVLTNDEPIIYLEQEILEDTSKNIRGGNPYFC